MKRLAAFSLLLFLVAGAAPDASAQFWKNWFGRKEQKRPVVRRKPAAAAPAAKKMEPRKPAKDADFPPTRTKPRYRIDVLVPLYLDELVKNDKPVYKDHIPDKAVPGVNFYEGVKLAADTLGNLYNIDVFIHDITAEDAAPEQLIAAHRLDSTDLIIGAVTSAQIKPLATFAKAHTINFISALSPGDAGIKDNPYFTLLQPTLQSHCEWIREAVAHKYKNGKPVVLYRTSPAVDESAYNYFVHDDAASFRPVLCNVLPSAESLRRYFDSTATNVVIVPIVDQVYAENLLNLLSKDFSGYRFEVYGMPSWKSLSSLRNPLSRPNVAVSYTTPFYYDVTTASGQALSNRYRKVFDGRPGEMVFRGYEVLLWYAYLLNRYGTIFNQRFSDNGSAPFTRYEIKMRRDKDNHHPLYNENQHLYLVRYQAGSYMVEQQ